MAYKYGKPEQLYYKFLIKNLKKNYIIDSIGWCRYHHPLRKDFVLKSNLFFCFINRKKLIYWLSKGVSFNKKSEFLLLDSGFLETFLNKDEKANSINLRK